MSWRAVLLLGPDHCARFCHTYTYYCPERIGNDAKALTMSMVEAAPCNMTRGQ
jgi:hypothetical protein